jgi:hypothetical protein
MTPRDELLASRGIVIRAEARFSEFHAKEGKELTATTVTVSRSEIQALRNTLEAYVHQSREIIRLEEILRDQIKAVEDQSQGLLFTPEDPPHPRPA